MLWFAKGKNSAEKECCWRPIIYKLWDYGDVHPLRCASEEIISGITWFPWTDIFWKGVGYSLYQKGEKAETRCVTQNFIDNLQGFRRYSSELVWLMKKGRDLAVILGSPFYVALESLIIFLYHGELIQGMFGFNNSWSAFSTVKMSLFFTSAKWCRFVSLTLSKFILSEIYLLILIRILH